jgi:hypothetical protein
LLAGDGNNDVSKRILFDTAYWYLDRCYKISLIYSALTPKFPI